MQIISHQEATARYRDAFARQKRRERIRERLFGIALLVFLSGLFGVLIGLAAGR